MLPSLSRLRLGPDPDPVEIGYAASQICPDPPGAGDLRKGVELTPGDSGNIYRAADPRNSFIGAGRTKTISEETEDDWKLGTLVLEKDATFIHVATSRLPQNLLKGEFLRTDRRVYAHTDTKNWTWKGADRVYIQWPAGMPFQIMGTLRGQDAYQRSCRYLQTNDAVTITPNEKGVIDWPFANVATVIPSALYSVVETPTRVKSPIEFALSMQQFEELGRSATTDPGSLNDETIFTSESADDLKALQMEFEGVDESYQQYSAKLETNIGDGGRKRKKAFMVAIAMEDSNLMYKLTVHRTCMYTSLILRATALDMTGYVAAGVWDPRKYTFQAPYTNYPMFQPPPPVVVDERFQEQLYMQTFISAYNNTPLNIQIALWRLNPQTPIVSMGETDYVSWFESSYTPPSASIMPLVIRMFKKNEYESYEGMAVLLQRLFASGKIIVDSTFSREVKEIVWRILEDDAKRGKELLRSMKTVLASDERLFTTLLNYMDGDGNPEDVLQFLIDDLGLEVPQNTRPLSNYP
jgi:hypothetical protein